MESRDAVQPVCWKCNFILEVNQLIFVPEQGSLLQQKDTENKESIHEI